MVESKHIIIGLIIVVTGLCIALYFQSVKYAEVIEKQIEIVQEEIDTREEHIKRLQDMIMVYSDEIAWMNGQIERKQIAIDSLRKVRNEIPDIVDNLPVSDLDSILSNYRHPGE